MPETTIEWASHSWNRYTWDCTRLSPGCKNCYMMERARRYGKPLVGRPQLRGASAIRELMRFPAGAVVFVNSMSDTYHEGVPAAWIHGIHNAAAYLRPDITFLLLTKRPERALSLAPYLIWPPNLWLGTSVESDDYLWRLDYLLQTPAAGHFVSAEPLLDALPGLESYLGVGMKPAFLQPPVPQNGWQMLRSRRLKWVIVGAESGANRRPFDKAWAATIRDLCVEARVPFLFKQGSAYKSGQNRLLDGREWNESPFLPPQPPNELWPKVQQLTLF